MRTSSAASLLLFIAVWANAAIFGPTIEQFSVVYQFFFLSPTLFLLLFVCNGIGKFKSFFIFTVFYSLGYAIYLYVIHATIDQYSPGGWMAIGNFDFSQQQLETFVHASFALVAGLYIGQRLFLVTTSSRIMLVDRSLLGVSDKRLNLYINIWALLSFTLIAFMSFFGLGRTGLLDATVMPFGLKGFLFYARLILVPLFGFYFLDISSRLQDKYLLNKVILLMTIIALAISILFFSRSELVFFMVPMAVYLATHSNLAVKSLSRSFLLKAIIVIIFGTQAVQIGRNVYYGDTSFGVSLGDIGGAIDAFGIDEAIQNLLILFTVRQGGARDMVVVLNSSYDSIGYVWDFFWQINENGFMYDVWGFAPETLEQEGKSFGTGFNGFGWYGFGSSISLIFALSVLTGWFSCWVENIFIKRNLVAAQYFMVFYITITLWNSFVWGRAWRIVPFIIFSAFLIDMLDKKLFPSKTLFVAKKSQ